MVAQIARALTAIMGLTATAFALAGDAGLPLTENFQTGAAPIKDAVLALAATDDGCLFVGSNQLAVFDGDKWETVEVPNAYGFRGLAVECKGIRKSGRVWIGAIGAVGYTERGSGETWHYTSLLPQLRQAGINQVGDVWGVFALGDRTVWVASDKVLSWDGNSFTVWTLPNSRRLYAYLVGTDLLIYQDGVGLLRLDKDGPKLLITQADLPAKSDLVSVVPMGNGAQWLIFPDHVFLDTAGQNQPLDELSEALQGKLTVCASRMPDGSVAIGTFLGGVIVASVDGHVRAVVDEAHGLGEDGVNTLLTDALGGLWVGLGNGLGRIDGVAVASVFDRRNGLDKGSPRKVIEHEGTPWILTSRSLFRVTPGDNESPAQLAGRKDIQAKLADAVSIDRHLWVGGFGGIWLLGEKGLEHAVVVPGDVLQLSTSSKIPGGMIFNEDYIPKALTQSPYGWASHQIGPKLDDTPLSLLEDGGGDIWISTILGEIHRFAVKQDSEGRPILQAVGNYSGGRLPSHAQSPRLSMVGKQVIAFTESNILRLNNAETAFEPEPGAKEWIGIAATSAENDTSYWIVQPKNLAGTGTYALVRLQNRITSDPEFTPLSCPGIDKIGLISHLDVLGDKSSPTLWISGSTGVLRIETAQLQTAPKLVSPLLETFREASDPTTRHLSFRYRSPQALSDNGLFYQTSLEGVATAWSAPSRDPKKDYVDLRAGTYAFKARVEDRFGRVSESAVYGFEVLAPWYARWPAIACYAGGLALATASVMRRRVRRLQRQTKKLNLLVSERTRELALANTAKSEFLENISHEIRNPLNGIVGLISMVKDENLPEREQELSRSLKVCVQNLERVFEEILGFSKLEYGYVKVEEKEFDLKALLEEITRLFSVQAKQMGCEVKTATDEHTSPSGHPSLEGTQSLAAQDSGSPLERGARRAGGVETSAIPHHFLGDPDKIRTIVGNFVSNAIKYASGKPVEIAFEIEPDAAGRQIATIEVKDHGPGVPETEHELIFEKFVRGSNTREHEIPGTGLGLATCRVLAGLMQGSVGVESPSDDSGKGGSTFWLRVPLKRTEEAHTPRPIGHPSLEGTQSLAAQDSGSPLERGARRAGVLTPVMP